METKFLRALKSVIQNDDLGIISRPAYLMKNFQKAALAISFLMPFFPLLADPVIWTGRKTPLLPESVQAFSDPEAALKLEEVRQQDFHPVRSLNFSMSTAAQWIRFSVRSESDESVFLRLSHPLLDELDIYIIGEDGIKPIHTGRSVPVSLWPIATADFIVPLNLMRSQTAEVYIRMVSGNSRTAPVEFTGIRDLLEDMMVSTVLYAMILGGMLFITLNNVILFIALRDLSHLYFAGYMLSVFLFLLGFTGYGTILVWGNLPYLSERLVTICIGASTSSLLFFQAQYLRMKRRRPIFYRIFQIIGISYLLQMILTLLPSYIYAAMIGVYGSPLAALLLISVSVLEIKRSREGRMLFFSWMIVLLAAVIFAAKVAGLLPDHRLIHILLPLGFVGQMLFINFTLSRRVNDLNNGLKKQKERMLQERKRLKEMLDRSHTISVNLKDLSEREKEMAVRLNHLSQEEASMSEQLSSAMEEVFARTEGVRQTIQNQNQKAGVIGASLQELLRTRDTVREAINHAMSFFDEIRKGFEVYQSNLDELMKRMHSIRDAGNVIEDVVKLIRDVTERINMLSLNASIEAARAGEYGRGFSVVAEEVGKLAEETALNSRKIQSQVSLMEGEMKGGLDAARQSESSIGSFLTSLSHIHSLLVRVSESMDVLDDAVSKLEFQSRENQHLSDEIFQASGEQLESLKESLSGVSRLAQMAALLSKNNDEILELSRAILKEAERLNLTIQQRR